MNRRIRKQSSAMKSEYNSYLRYLKPGALAQIRDSKINARSNLRSHDSQIFLHRSIPSSPTSSPPRAFNTGGGIIQQQQQEVTGTITATDGELAFLAVRFHTPRCLQRKKLMAVRSMCYLNHNSSGVTSDGPVPFINVL